MKISSAKYAGQQNSLEECPPDGNPEFAFIGRSNVGKSSLINLLTNHKGLAKVSVTPGKTRAIQLFDINNTFFLVDLPGYGYAKVSHDVNEAFTVASADYLSKRAALKTIFVLIDSRHEPQEIDLTFLAWVQPFQRELILVFTKCDLSTKACIQTNVNAFHGRMASLGLPAVRHLCCSSKNGSGKTLIFEQIQKHLPRTEKAAQQKRKTSSAWLKNIGK